MAKCREAGYATIVAGKIMNRSRRIYLHFIVMKNMQAVKTTEAPITQGKSGKGKGYR